MKTYEIVYNTFDYDLEFIVVEAKSEKEALEKVDKNLGQDFKIFREIKNTKRIIKPNINP